MSKDRANWLAPAAHYLAPAVAILLGYCPKPAPGHAVAPRPGKQIARPCPKEEL